MAKKKPTSRTDAVRQAVDQAFQTQIPREKIGELLDELGHTAGRLRGAVDDLRPASTDDVKLLRADLRKLTARVAALESAAKPKPAARRPAAKATASERTAAKSAAAAKPAQPRKTGATRSAPSASAAKPRKPAKAKPKSSGES